MTIFAKYGYAHASIRKIAQHAGVSTELLYHYFANKEELLHAVFDDCMEMLSEDFAGAYEIAEPLGKIRYLVQYIFDALQNERKFWGLFYSLRSQPAVMVVLRDSIRLWTEGLRNHFTDWFREAGRSEAVIDAYILYCLNRGNDPTVLIGTRDLPARRCSQLDT